MRFNDREEEVPNLWIRKEGGFGTRQAAAGCGTVSACTEAVRQAMREARKGEPLKVSETVEEARKDLEAYVIHVLFFEGTASDLAAEYLKEIHGLDVLAVPFVWVCYTQAAREIGCRGEVPVPVLVAEGEA